MGAASNSSRLRNKCHHSRPETERRCLRVEQRGNGEIEAPNKQQKLERLGVKEMKRVSRKVLARVPNS